MKKIILMSALLLGACQSLPQQNPISASTTQTQSPSFAITGKIGVVSHIDGQRVAGSAFYNWGQERERFAIDLTGALGMGATQIRYDGKQATLTSEQAGTLSADSPQALLYTATGWQAPIDVMPFWVMGRQAPNDHNPIWQAGQLTQSQNGDWVVAFDYSGSLPSKLVITHKDGHRVVMTITHVAQ